MPLMSLEAVALDTETTGLDARAARLVEIAIVPLRHLELAPGEALQRLVDPQCPIPTDASEVHGISAADLVGAPTFGDIAAGIEATIGTSVVIGHNIGFDLAVIDREQARAGLTWSVPRFLDVRALARLADPHLASYELGTLCDWLGVDIGRRHRALPDAVAAGRVFIGLVPLLRSVGIRTLAEAEAASRRHLEEGRQYQIGGWISPAEVAQAHTAPSLAAVDSYPYRHRLRDLPLQTPLVMEAQTGVAEAARKLTTAVGETPGAILTTTRGGDLACIEPTDILLALTATNGGPAQIGEMPLRPLPIVEEDDFLFRALGRMGRLGVSHIGVRDRTGKLLGTLSAADLLRHRVTSALALGDEIEAATTVPQLGHAWASLRRVVASLLEEGIAAPDIAGIISAEIRNLTGRAARMAEERMAAEGKGPPPCAYAVLVLGSGGRGDALLTADQDNAMVYAEGDPEGPQDRWFAAAGGHLSDILNEVGIPFCSGGVMAKNPGCRHSLAIWRTVVSDWVSRAAPADALASDIFFDAVPVHGDLVLAGRLLDTAFELAGASPRFIASLVALNTGWQPPISMLGRLKQDGDGRIDLKRNGLLPIATAARALALRHGIRPTSTLARLAETKARGLADVALLDRATTAFEAFSRAVLAQQVRDTRSGVSPSPRVEVARLSAGERADLLAAMRSVYELIGTTLGL